MDKKMRAFTKQQVLLNKFGFFVPNSSRIIVETWYFQRKLAISKRDIFYLFWIKEYEIYVVIFYDEKE